MDTQRLQNLVKYRKYAVMKGNWRLVDGTELYDLSDDPGQQQNIIGDHPDLARQLAEGYERWWQSFVDEGVNERYAHIKVGTPYENPSRICSHDMLTGALGYGWHQYGAANAIQASGTWKIQVVETGNYVVSLRRFPRESGLGINAEFQAAEKPRRLETAMPASRKAGFKEAFLYIADFSKTVAIEEGADEVRFEMKLTAGKYNMEARLLDAEKKVHPAYFVYIEKK
jgi:hypothetical protein